MAIQIAPQFTIRNYRWTQWKQVQSIKNFIYQHDDDGDIYTIWGYDGPEAHIAVIWKDVVPDGIQNSGYSQEQNNLDKLDFENNYLANSNLSIDKRDSEGRSIQVPVPRVGKELIVSTHNFADPTTWFGDSVRVEDEVLSSADGYVWQSSNVNWIDLDHGKIFDEDSIKLDVPHNYNVIVKVDGYVKSVCPPYTSINGDYFINYDNGSITFLQNQLGKNVTVSYSYATTSTWYLSPSLLKKISVEEAEAQFSADVIMTNSIEFQIWAYNPYDLPNKIMIDTTSYKKMTNFIDEALGSYPIIPAVGGPDRGTQSAVYGFPFRYGTVRELRSSQGVELRVRIKDDVPFGGEYCTATFYCTVTDE